MEKKTLRGLLMGRCFWRAATVICLIISLQLLALSVWQIRRNPGRAESFAENGSAGLYAELNVVEASEAFAQSGGNSFYFFIDPNDYLYVAVLSNWQYFDLRSKLDGGAEQVSVIGMSIETPDTVRQLACDYFGDIEYSEYASYFGVSYLDCTRTPYTAAFEWLLAGAILSAVLCLICLIYWQSRRGRVRRMLYRLERMGKLSIALKQIQNALPEQVEGHLTVTEDFFYDARLGTLYVRSEMKDLELRRPVLGTARLRARCSGRMVTAARLSKKQRLRIRELFRTPANALTAGSFAAPQYWNVPEQS